MRGRLLTADFLEVGIRRTVEYQSVDAEAVTLAAVRLRAIVEPLLAHLEPNESTTEREVVEPVLEVLGWRERLPQQRAGARRTDVPDFALFENAEKKAAAAKVPEEQRYQHAVSFLEAKRWGRPLDRASADPLDPDVPSNQMLRYLSRVDAASKSGIRFAWLTNGRIWRIYDQASTNRAEEFFEVDLLEVLGLSQGSQTTLELMSEEDRLHAVRCFLVLGSPESFAPRRALDSRSFLERAREEARLWEARVAADLSAVVFRDVFPALAGAFFGRDTARPKKPDEVYLAEVRDAALIVLYRLLFVLYAEDRNLLPAGDARYDGYSLRRLRQEVARHLDRGETLSTSQARMWTDLRTLCRAVAEGDDSLGVPPYNGGLFSDSDRPLLARVSIADAAFALTLDALSRREENGVRLWINYRDLSVQQLGSIYEQLLEHRVVINSRGEVEIARGIFARRTSGSYFTAESLVRLVIERAVDPLIEERRDRFLASLEEVRANRLAPAVKASQLAAVDPASALLELKICDPAMGSGHFLVSLVDHLADRALELASEAAAKAAEVLPKLAYRSPLETRCANIRDRLLANARAHGWPVREDQLDDRHIVRRMILKRVIYGVDLNPMAVELAKLSLWLHSFTVGAPLSFLDHHLRCGNSLVGSRVEQVRAELERSSLFGSAYAGMLAATGLMEMLEELTDADIAEVRQSLETFELIESSLEPYRRLLDLDAAHVWLAPEGRAEGKRWLPPRDLLSGFHGDPLGLVRQPEVVPGRAGKTLRAALALAKQERFFHWELHFPEVWYETGRSRAVPGFDAVIGNPPWDRAKLQEIEFFAERRAEISAAATAAERKRRIEAIRKARDPLYADYLAAAAHAEAFASYVRNSAQYPLLSGGDVNLYALFLERAASLVRSVGVVGLLVPSGIAGDFEKAAFFGELATSGRILALLDFENRKRLFPHVDSRFKFAVFAFGGPERKEVVAACAFFLHDPRELDGGEREFTLGPEDFARVNPNTRTAPVFRTRRDAEITKGIYERLPVLVDRRDNEVKNLWGIRYATLFHMTNDSGLFRTSAELQAEGFYPVSGKRWKKGGSLYLPLYEGKMVQAYDHRAASVIIRAENLHRPAQPLAATLDQKKDPKWLPTPQSWVPELEVRKALSELASESSAAGPMDEETAVSSAWYLTFKDVTAPTNIRTMIAAICPRGGLGNTLPALLNLSANRAGWLLSLLNSLPFDFVCRQKVQGQHLNLFILEQVAAPYPEAFVSPAGGRTLGDQVLARVLRLTYTAHDLQPFARELGYSGPPFAWDEEERRHLLAQLDAIAFRLYGLDKEDTGYVLSTFPSVERADQILFGRFRTRELILGYMRAHAADDYSSRIEI
jgi:hypothetical protein